MITATAPGKVVVSGEYAVLAGAPALVAAVDRRVSCALTATDGDTWRFASRGYAGASTHTLDALIDGSSVAPADPAWLCHHVLRALIAHGVPADALPRALHVAIDSSACYHAGQKLGLGSSAAVTVALTAALARQAAAASSGVQKKGQTPNLNTRLTVMLEAHAAAQGGRGSGLDVAASERGGLIAFRRNGSGVRSTQETALSGVRSTQETALSGVRSAHDEISVESAALPRGVSYLLVSTGAAASTPKQLVGFDAWRRGARPPSLAALCSAAERTAGALHDAATFMRELRAYVSCLEAMDRVAGLGIFPESHRVLMRLAAAAGVTYKPCGAGGGDVGMAFALERSPLDRFGEQTRAAGCFPLPLELTQHGVEVRT